MSVYIVNDRRAVAHLYREVKQQRHMFYRQLFRDHGAECGPGGQGREKGEWIMDKLILAGYAQKRISELDLGCWAASQATAVLQLA